VVKDSKREATEALFRRHELAGSTLDMREGEEIDDIIVILVDGTWESRVEGGWGGWVGGWKVPYDIK
jgi:hypothetical protein